MRWGGSWLCSLGLLGCSRPGLGLRFFRQRRLHRLTLAALLLDALIGNVIDHRCSGLNIAILFFLFRVFLPGAVGNGPDDTGNGDFHRPQQGEYHRQGQQHIGNHVAAEPAQQHGKAAAEHTAAGACQAAGIEVGDDGKALGHALGLHHQMVNAAAEKHE